MIKILKQVTGANFSRCGFDRQPFIFACFFKVHMFVETKVGQDSNTWFLTSALVFITKESR